MCLYPTNKLGGNRKWKIQNGGLHPWNAYISAPRRASNAIPSAIPYVFDVSHINGTCIYTARLNWEETASGNSKMAAYTHEMRISQLPDELAMRFQLLNLCFLGQPYQRDMCLYRTTKLGGNRKWKIQDGGLHPCNAYISATILKRIWYHAKVLQRVHSITFWTWN